MRRVLLVGYDPALPPGMNVENIRGGIALALKQMTDRGWEADLCLVRPDETAGPTLERQLAFKSYGCVVIGARVPPMAYRHKTPPEGPFWTPIRGPF